MRPHTGKIEDEYAWAAEVNMATLSGLCFVKKSSLADITRQRNICAHMLKICHDHKDEIAWGGELRKHYPRVEEVLLEGSNLPDALNAFTKECFDKPGQAERWFKSFERSEKDRRASDGTPTRRHPDDLRDDEAKPGHQV